MTGLRLPCALVICLLSGCTGATVERHFLYQEACAGRFVALMKAGETTRGEEQDFIRASERAWHFLREAMGIEAVQSRLEEDDHDEGESPATRQPVRRRAR